MSTNDGQSGDQGSGGGGGTNSFAAQHTTPPRRPLNVAPTDGSTKFNTIRIPLIPVACWRLDDPAFAFDSSFVAPTFRFELESLLGILAANPGCPATLFGHCDPAGSDSLNKTLGDRRVIAVYAVLTRQPDLWEYLYDNAQVGDSWDLHMVQAMLASVPDASGDPYYDDTVDGIKGPNTTDAVKRFQGDAGLTADGDPGKDTRKALFGAYMDWLFTSDDDAPSPGAATPAAPRMQPTDFLGGAGAQTGDLPKMSLQSCGKFNPVVLLPSSEMSQSDTVSRNDDDAPNRRVIMLLFPKGTTVDSSVWPCPKVKETNDACKAQFWPDGDARRQNGGSQRLYKDTHDTMACRFYDRFARRSPCEKSLPEPCVMIVPQTFATQGNVIGYVEFFGKPPDDPQSLSWSGQTVDGLWLSSDKKLYFYPPANGASGSGQSVQIDGVSYAVVNDPRYVSDTLPATRSIIRQMQVMRSALKLRLKQGGSDLRNVYESVLNQAHLSFVAAMDAITESGDATNGDACVQALETYTQRSSKEMDHMLATFFPRGGGSPPPDPNTNPPPDPAIPPQVDPTTPVA